VKCVNLEGGGIKGNYKKYMMMIIIIIIIIIITVGMPSTGKRTVHKKTIECAHNYTSTYARKQGYNWTKKNPSANMYPKQ
jgi:hypothetical protein